MARKTDAPGKGDVVVEGASEVENPEVLPSTPEVKPTEDEKGRPLFTEKGADIVYIDHVTTTPNASENA